MQDNRNSRDETTAERMSSSDLRYVWMILTAPQRIKSKASSLRQFIESLKAVETPVHQCGDYKFLWKTLLQDFHPEDAVELLKKLPGIEVTGGELMGDGARISLSAVWRAKEN